MHMMLMIVASRIGMMRVVEIVIAIAMRMMLQISDDRTFLVAPAAAP